VDFHIAALKLELGNVVLDEKLDELFDFFLVHSIPFESVPAVVNNIFTTEARKSRNSCEVSVFKPPLHLMESLRQAKLEIQNNSVYSVLPW
jgi:hypothetical protein